MISETNKLSLDAYTKVTAKLIESKFLKFWTVQMKSITICLKLIRTIL